MAPVDFVGYWLSGNETIELQRPHPTRDGPWTTFDTVVSSSFPLHVLDTDLYGFSTSTVIPGWVSTGCGEEVYVRVQGTSLTFNAVTFDGENADVEQTGMDCIADEIDAGNTLINAATTCASEDYPVVRLRTQLLGGTLPGGVTISDQSEADEIACYREIDGTLTVADSSALSISLAHLERVTGDVHLFFSRDPAPGDAPDVREILLPSLHTIEGDLFVHYPGEGGETVDFDVGLPALTSLGGDLTIDLVTFNAHVSGIDALESIPGNVAVTTSGDDYHSDFLLPSLAWVGGDMDFALGGTTTGLFDAVEEVGGDLRIVGAFLPPGSPSLGVPNFESLATVHGDVAIAASEVVTVPGLPHQFPLLSTVDGTLDIDAGGIDGLFVGDDGGMNVGNLRLNQNFGLTDLAVTHVDVADLGTIEITNNANLSECDAWGFVDGQAAMGWMGSAMVSGNGPC